MNDQIDWVLDLEEEQEWFHNLGRADYLAGSLYGKSLPEVFNDPRMLEHYDMGYSEARNEDESNL